MSKGNTYFLRGDEPVDLDLLEGPVKEKTVNFTASSDEEAVKAIQRFGNFMKEGTVELFHRIHIS